MVTVIYQIVAFIVIRLKYEIRATSNLRIVANGFMIRHPEPHRLDPAQKCIVRSCLRGCVGICHFRSVLPCFIPLVFVALLLTSRSCSLNAR
jgi:hypothetical protein